MKFILKVVYLLIVSGFVCDSTTFAQAPQFFNYQGIARDLKGNPMSNQSFSLKISILPAADALQSEYEEIQNVVTNEFGLYTIRIGSGKIVSGAMKSVKWKTGNKYIKVAIDLYGDNQFEEMGITQLLSVPYALFAENAASIADDELPRTRAGTVTTSAAGTGTVNFLSKFTAANTIYNSQIFDNGTNIGIGTVSPAYKLQVEALSGNADIMVRTLGSANAASFRLRNSAGAELGINKFGPNATGTFMGLPKSNMAAINNFTSGSFVFNSGGDIAFGNTLGQVQIPRMFISGANGNVGIGTLTPVAKLDVAGQIRISGGNPGSGKVLTSDANGLATWQSVGNNAGNALGDIQYWDGNSWVFLPIGTNGQTLVVTNGIPAWVGGLAGGMASVSTTSISGISNVSCTIGGDVTNNGGSPVTARGFVYNTAPNPTLANMTVQNGSGLGGYSNTVSGLQPATTYYIRSYATNTTGTNYGNQVMFVTSANVPYTIGMPGPAGGFVFYDKGSYTNGWRYLEVAPYDQSLGVVWGCYGTNIANTNYGIGEGFDNSQIILSNCTSVDIAARICDTLILNGYSDWHLPSRDEFFLINDNLFNFNVGNFALTNYWSSTQSGQYHGFSFNFGNSQYYSSYKTELYRVRAIRRF